MSDPIQTIQLPSNLALARAYFPQLARSLPQYRDDLLRHPHTWTRVSRYISTLYVALECASSPEHLAILKNELQAFDCRLPPHTRYQPATDNPFGQAIYDLVQQSAVPTALPLHQDHIFRLLSIICTLFSLITDQGHLDVFRQMLEPISTRFGQFSQGEDA